MIDINLIRNEETRMIVKKSEEKRFRSSKTVDEIYELDKQKIKLNFDLDAVNREINKIQKEVRTFFKENKGATKEDIKDKVDMSEAKTKEAIELQDQIKKVDNELNSLLKGIGNIIDESVVVSKDEENNAVVSSYRTTRELEKQPKPFSELMKKFTHSEAGAKVIGHRGYYLSGKLAKLAMALSRYAIDFLENRKYLYIQTPVMLRRDVMAKTSQLSDFDDQLYKVEDDIYLIATSEQSLTALYMDERLTAQDLPMKFAGHSLCFRKEAGAHGKDNAGIFRVHQFEKVEQFVLCAPEDSEGIHKEMISISEEFYRTLDLSYNVVSIVSGELNDAAALKYDLEAYFPYAEKYRELVSCSNCTDYQSRELEIRYGLTKENNKKVYVHMLNGTMCAVQRTLCCIVENYQKGNKIIIPEVLRGYFGEEEIDLDE